MSLDPGAVSQRQLSKGDFYRYCRLVHGWLSALAFLLLCFFSVTGLLLNHPGWATGKAPEPMETNVVLPADELDRLRDSAEPGETLAEIAATKTALRGSFSDGNRVGNEVFTRLQGVRGLTDLRANLITGKLKVIVEPAPPMSILNELHRAERAGVEWRLLVDVVAVLLLLLSLIGYLIFLSMRFRLRTALLLTTGSTVGVWAFFALLVR